MGTTFQPIKTLLSEIEKVIFIKDLEHLSTTYIIKTVGMHATNASGCAFPFL